MIVDSARPLNPGALKAAGVTGIIRYIGWDGMPGHQDTGKNLTRGELAGYLGEGIAVGLSFEYAANAALLGEAQGAADAGLANDQVAALGIAGTGVYYAVDIDLPDFAPQLPGTPENSLAKLGPVGAYFEAIHHGDRNHGPDGYGGYWAVRRLADAGLAAKPWQTLAWSPRTPAGVQVDPRAVLFQNGRVTFGGVADVDMLEPRGVPDWGQWPRPEPPKPPRPEPRRLFADGKQSLLQLCLAEHTTPAEVLWETSLRHPGGLGPLEVQYLDIGSWSRTMPEGMAVWIPA